MVKNVERSGAEINPHYSMDCRTRTDFLRFGFNHQPSVKYLIVSQYLTLK